MSIKYKTTLLLPAFFCLPFLVSAQIATKLNIESGAYLDLSKTVTERTSTIHKLFGNITYKYNNENKNASISLKVRPQFFKSDFHSIKYGFDGIFVHKFKNFLWRPSFSLSQYNLNFSLLNTLYNTFAFVNQFEFSGGDNFTIEAKLGYSYQDINDVNTIKSDFFFVNPILNKNIDNYSYLGFGLYVQKFATESELSNNFSGLKSTGWKYGPNIKLHYLRKFLFNVEYKFLIHNSNSTVYPSYEHNINLLSGTVVNKNLSIFLLVEFNFVRTKVKPDVEEKCPIYFFPTQNENKVYIKTSYRLKKNFSIYAKLGYFRENFYLDDFKLDGLNFLLGIQLVN